MASESSGYQAFTTAAVSSTALHSASIAGDYGGVSFPEEEVFCQHQILKHTHQVQEAAFAQTYLQSCIQLEDFEGCQLVQQLNNDQ
eukprot:3724582-Ditylum_brightwellii.AAC.1